MQRSNWAFRQIPVDQAIEQTINRDSKTKGGIIDFSKKTGAVQKWIASAHRRAEISRNCLDMAGLCETQRHCTRIVEQTVSRKMKLLYRLFLNQSKQEAIHLQLKTSLIFLVLRLVSLSQMT